MTTSVMHQVHFARIILKLDGLQGGIIEFDGLHSKPSHLTVGTPDHRIGRSALSDLSARRAFQSVKLLTIINTTSITISSSGSSNNSITI